MMERSRPSFQHSLAQVQDASSLAFGQTLFINKASRNKEIYQSLPSMELDNVKIIESTVDKKVKFSFPTDDNKRNELDNISFLTNNNKNTLYGRKEEKGKLRDAFRRQTGTLGFLHRKRELVLLSGKSGRGKTALANTLREHVQKAGGYFITGKFEQYQRAVEPYAPLKAAFTQFVDDAIKRDNSNSNRNETSENSIVDCLKIDINNEIESEEEYIINMIPALEKIIGKVGKPNNITAMTKRSNIGTNISMASSAVVKGSSDSHKQIKHIFRRFVRAVCSPERPVVLFIDDMQWADASSLELLHDVVTDEEHNGGLMVLVACRYDEVPIDHDFSSFLRNLEAKHEITINVITVGNLKESVVNTIISDALNQPETKTRALAELIYNQSHGNALYTIEILKSLHEDGVLYVDPYNKSQWSWDENKVLACDKFNGGDVVNFIARKMECLPVLSREVLKVASCLGVEFNNDLICKIYSNKLSDDISDALHFAEYKGFIIEKNNQRGGYKFTHDRFHEGAYSLIPTNERNHVRLSIGRRLWKALSNEEVDLNIFLMIHLLTCDIGVLEDQDEKYDIASLCLRAGEKSHLSSDFSMASSYYKLGISLLGPKHRHWRVQYDLSLSLYNAASEAYYCTAKFEQMDTLIEDVLVHGRTFQDKIQAYHTKVYSLGAKLKLAEAIETGIFVLKCLGEEFPSRLRSIYLLRDVLKTKRMLRGKSNDGLLKLPDMRSTEKVAAMQMMSLLATYTYLSRCELFPFLCCRAVQLSLSYGLTSASAQAFNGMSLILCNIGEVGEGYRLGKLSLSILERYNSKHWLPRVYAVFYGITGVLKQPLSASLEPLLYAHRVGLKTGDIEYSLLNANFYCQSYFMAGLPLNNLEKKATYFRDMMKEYRQDVWLDSQNVLLQTVHNFLGKSKNGPLVLTGEACDQESALKRFKETGNDLLFFYLNFLRLQLAYYFNEYKLALEMAEAIRQVEDICAIKPYAYYYLCLVSLAMVRVDVKRKRHHMKAARRHYKKIKKNSHNSLEYFLNKLVLIEAEFESINGTRYDAKRRYDESIQLADDQGILHEQALACERAGMAMQHLDDEHSARQYFLRARSLYTKWQARAKVEQIEKKYAKVFNQVHTKKRSIPGKIGKKMKN